jgi:hypothetical protein
MGHSYKEDVRVYHELAYGINTQGHKATKEMVKKWEATATDLLKRTGDSRPRYPPGSLRVRNP